MSGALAADRLFGNTESRGSLQPASIRKRYFELADADATLDISNDQSDNASSGSILAMTPTANPRTITVSNPVIGSYLIVVNKTAATNAIDVTANTVTASVAADTSAKVVFVNNGSGVAVPVAV